MRRWIGKEFNFSVANLHEELRLRFGNQFQQSLIFNLREKVALLQRDGVADGRGELTPAYIPCQRIRWNDSGLTLAVQRYRQTECDPLGAFLIILGGWLVSGRSISEGVDITVLILGIAAFLIHSGHIFS